MSSKIDGVPRELLERLAHVLYMHDAEKTGAATELDALIAAPVVERKPNAWATLQTGWKDEDRTVITDQSEAEQYNRQCYDLTPLFTSPPELAELKATIAELSNLLGQARGMVNGASDEWHNSVEKVLGHE
jgi:hypothetical protein